MRWIRKLLGKQKIEQHIFNVPDVLRKEISILAKDYGKHKRALERNRIKITDWSKRFNESAELQNKAAADMRTVSEAFVVDRLDLRKGNWIINITYAKDLKTVSVGLKEK